jgi:hypothetical protein
MIHATEKFSGQQPLLSPIPGVIKRIAGAGHGFDGQGSSRGFLNRVAGIEHE